MAGMGTAAIGDTPLGAANPLGDVLIGGTVSQSRASATLSIVGAVFDGATQSVSAAGATLTAVQPLTLSAKSTSAASASLSVGQPQPIGETLSRSNAKATLITSTFPPGASVGFIRCA